VSALALAILAGIALPVLLLSIPLRLSLRLALSPPEVVLTLGWPPRWLPEWRLRPGRPRRPEVAPPEAPAPARPPRRRLSRHRQRRLLAALPRFLGAMMMAFRVERLSLRGRFGTGDPALTGEVYGALAPMMFGTVGVPRVDLRLEPDFGRRTLSGEGQVVLCLRPIALAGPTLRFLWAGFGPTR
jgi:hypothetical protein